MANGYWKPRTIKEALALERKQPGSRFLAGGTELERLGSAVSAESLIDLKALGLDKITPVKEGLSLGSMVTFTQALESDLVPQPLKEALFFMGSMPKRNMATIGGNVMRHGSDSYLVPTLAAYDAMLVFQGEKRQRVALSAFLKKPAKYERMVLAHIILDPSRTVVSVRYSNTRESHAAVTLALGTGGRRGQLVLVGAVKGSGISLYPKSGKALEKGVERDAFHAVVAREVKAVDDISGSAAYKRYLVEEGFWSLSLAVRRKTV